MTVYLVIDGFTLEAESVHAIREGAEARLAELGDDVHEIIEMPLHGVDELEVLA